MIQTILTRRSVRAFLPEAVPQDSVRKLLATHSPGLGGSGTRQYAL